MPLTFAAIVVAIGINILWGGTYVAVKLGLGDIPPLWSAFFRFALGLICVIGWAVVMRIPLWPARDDWLALTGLSAIFAAQIVLMNFALTLTGAGITSVLISAHPLFAAALAHFVITTERLTWRKSLGLAIAFAGTAYVMLDDPASTVSTQSWGTLGNWLALASGVVLGSRFVVQAQVLQRREPALVITWLMALSLPVFLVGALTLEQLDLSKVSWPAAAGIAYQGIVIAGLGFMTVAYLLKRFAATTTVSFGFINPISGVALSALLLGEPITLALVTAIVAVALGLFLIAR